MNWQAGGLAVALLCFTLAPAEAKVRLGDPLPAHPWASTERELVVIYGAGCGDLGTLWQEVAAVQTPDLPVRAVFAEGTFSAEHLPKTLARTPNRALDVWHNVWHGAEATAFARKLRVAHYPTILLVEQGRLLNVWEGQPDPTKQWRTQLGLGSGLAKDSQPTGFQLTQSN